MAEPMIHSLRQLTMPFKSELIRWLEIYFGQAKGNQKPSTTTVAGGGSPHLQVFVDTPDASANAFVGSTLSYGFSNMRRLIPYLSHSGDGYWTGAFRVPPDYFSTPTVTLTGIANATSGVVRLVVGSVAIPSGNNEDATFTDETAQNITVPGTAFHRFDTTFSITGSSPAAGDDLILRIKRNAANAADTCTAPYGLWAVVFDYVVAS